MNQSIELGKRTLSLEEIGGEIKQTFSVGKAEFVVVKGKDNELYLGNKFTNTIIVGPKEGFKGLLENETVLRETIKSDLAVSDALEGRTRETPNYGLIVIEESIWYIYENGTRERMKPIKGNKVKIY